MKTTNRLLKRMAFFTLIVLAFSCSKDDPADPGNPNPDGGVEELGASISTDEFETDQGEIGISLITRDIARKGHMPATVEISLTASADINDQVVEVDPFTNLANLVFRVDELEASVVEELEGGVPVEATVMDSNSAVLATHSFSKLSFKPSPEEQPIGSDGLDDLYAEVMLREDLKYYVQLVNKDNEVFAVPGSQRYPQAGGGADVRVREDTDYAGDEAFFEKYTTYRFAKIPNNEDYYSISVHNGPDIHYLYIDNKVTPKRLNIQSKGNLNANLGNTRVEDFQKFWFKIVKEGAGLFRIEPRVTANPLVVSGANIVESGSSDPADPVYFRILLFNIDWDIQALDAKFLEPIMPPSGTNSAYNSTLRNCSSGSLSQTIGENTTISTQQTAGWEETMSVSSTHSAGVTVTLGFEAKTSFFGVGGKASGSVSGSYDYTKTRTETNTRSGSLSTEKSVQVSVSREVGVPPGTAIAVADIYQQYQGIRVPFVQRFRIFGRYQEDNAPLTGQEILTQFAFNSFSGVVTQVDSDYIEVTVRGTTSIDRLVETTTESRDIANACSN